jgi:hypothetical protein
MRVGFFLFLSFAANLPHVGVFFSACTEADKTGIKR